MVTRDEDLLFSSFVNCAILATIYAAKNSKEMPLLSIFGSEFDWALRDALNFGGSYDEIYSKNFGDASRIDKRTELCQRRSPPNPFLSWPSTMTVNNIQLTSTNYTPPCMAYTTLRAQLKVWACTSYVGIVSMGPLNSPKI